MVTSKTYRMALKIAQALSGSTHEKEAFEILSRVCDLPELVWAKVTMKLQGLRNLPETSDTKCALEILQRDHAHAYLDYRATLVVKALKNGNLKEADELNDLILKYDRVEYPIGILRLLTDLQQAAFELRDFETLSETQENLERITDITGNRFLSLTLQTTALARSQLRTGFEDHVRQAAENLYANLEDTDLSWNRGHLAMVLCEIAIRFSNFDAARMWSAKCASNWLQCSIDARAMATELDLRIQYLSPPQPISNKSYAWYLAYFDNAIAAYQGRLADQTTFEVRSLDYLFNAAVTMPHLTLEKKEEALNDVFNRMALLDGSLGHEHMGLKAIFLQHMARQKQALGNQQQDWRLDLEALELMMEALKMHHQSANGKLTFELINTRQMVGTIWYTIFQKKLKAGHRRAAFEDLTEALESFERCLEGWRVFRLVMQEAECQYWIAQVFYNRFLYNFDLHKDLMQKLKQAEEGFDRRRLEVSVRKDLNCLRDKQALSKNKHARYIYRFAIQAGIVKRDDNSIWDWVQKSKARSLSDLIGLGAVVPASLMNSIRQDANALSLVTRETEIFKAAEAGTATMYVQAQHSLATIHQKMKEHPLTSSLLDIRFGTAISLTEIERLVNNPDSGLYGQNFVAFDWFISGQSIYLLAMSSAGRKIRHFRVNMMLSSVQSWIQTYLKNEEGQTACLEQADTADNPLRLLDSLIEHIPSVAEAGQLLVLCPSELLTALPLHALHLPSYTPGWQRFRPTLIERNPVVYASSLTTFVQCCRGAHDKSPSNEACFHSVYEQRADEDFDESERRDAYQYTKDLAAEYMGESAVGSNVTPELLTSQWARSSRIYFHGHCQKEGSNIMKQGVIISRTLETESSLPEGPFYEELFTVKSFFDISLNRPLVLLMACGSVSQEISAGDEPLGILTALLCAGAASVVGTIWPVASGPTRIFTKAFFDALNVEEAYINGGQSGTKIVNLAYAMQRAVKAVKGSHWRDIKHWAPFVLHGAFFQHTITKGS